MGYDDDDDDSDDEDDDDGNDDEEEQVERFQSLLSPVNDFPGGLCTGHQLTGSKKFSRTSDHRKSKLLTF